jgi:hypothetical protein
LPGHFVPIVNNPNYNNYEENLVSKTPAPIRYPLISEENLNNINSYEDEDDFKPTYGSAVNHHIPNYYQLPITSPQIIYGTKKPPTVNKYVYQADSEQDYQDEYPVYNGQNQSVKSLEIPGKFNNHSPFQVFAATSETYTSITATHIQL